MTEPIKQVENMTPSELKEFRNSFPCDDMGSDENVEEGVTNA